MRLRAGPCRKGLLPAPSGSQQWAVCWPQCLAAQDESVRVCRGSCRARGEQGSGRSSPGWDEAEVGHIQLGFHSEAEEGTGQGVGLGHRFRWSRGVLIALQWREQSAG